MAPKDKNEDRTRIRVPSKTSKNIPRRYSASIVIVEGHAEGMEYPLDKAYTVIGRDRNADIAVKDPLVSRRHVAIIYNDGAFVLKDLESTNGTFMKNGLIEEVPLRHRDKFRIGDTAIQFIVQEADAGSTYEVRDEDD